MRKEQKSNRHTHVKTPRQVVKEKRKESGFVADDVKQARSPAVRKWGGKVDPLDVSCARFQPATATPTFAVTNLSKEPKRNPPTTGESRKGRKEGFVASKRSQ